MTKILIAPEGKKILIDTIIDKQLYAGVRDIFNTNFITSEGKDLYVRGKGNDKKYYYFECWFTGKNRKNYFELINENEAKCFILKKEISGIELIVNGIDYKKIKELWGDDFFKTEY